MSLRGRLHPWLHMVSMACHAVRQISPGTRDAPLGASEFRGLSSEKFGHEGRVGLPERRGGAFSARRDPMRLSAKSTSFQPMAVFSSERACSRPGRGHAMPLCRQARDVVKIARFVRAFAENRANRGDFHETCLKLPLSLGRGGTGVHVPAPCGWRVLPSGVCGRKKITPRPLAGPGVACVTARETAGLQCAVPPRG